MNAHLRKMFCFLAAKLACSRHVYPEIVILIGLVDRIELSHRSLEIGSEELTFAAVMSDSIARTKSPEHFVEATRKDKAKPIVIVFVINVIAGRLVVYVCR